MIRSIVVSGIAYRVIESKSGNLKAYLNGYFGWTSVWAETEYDLARRIRQVRSGGQ
jgi:hypothetical protein